MILILRFSGICTQTETSHCIFAIHRLSPHNFASLRHSFDTHSQFTSDCHPAVYDLPPQFHPILNHPPPIKNYIRYRIIFRYSREYMYYTSYDLSHISRSFVTITLVSKESSDFPLHSRHPPTISTVIFPPLFDCPSF